MIAEFELVTLQWVYTWNVKLRYASVKQKQALDKLIASLRAAAIDTLFVASTDYLSLQGLHPPATSDELFLSKVPQVAIIHKLVALLALPGVSG
jgi:uncharacterized membrane protein affecting hemolysin expression